ncbi:YgiW/YdeI family stress tolerance OB fold protein [Enterobacillus tribolii]|uniref:Uncharacterized protein (TIGR00156 family) n=1 Tax=Enterobacillus tribolii TaxID=1487935 RepID=A0A370R508_9GAMM|nr:YgiW/YdeI family stress tolerance OB fold protein [Enterobacillus tribolii]MBW7983150.1 YgiW/YdeI family stress tolerance OB fold protein [Enterobacillus tribolii]RDK97205.1 uncharacterized protein (TIGR00156 family) [Enterobacillus tribolii]
MKKMTIMVLAAALIGAPALAQNGGFVDPNATTTQTTQSAPRGGFEGPGSSLTTVENAKSLNDDAWVILRGNIERRISEDTYIFRDKSGTINVEIDRKRWNGQTITPQDTIEIRGKVDKDWNSTEIDVKQVNKIN